MSDDHVSPALDTLVGDRARDDKGRFVPVPPTEVKEPEKTPEPVKAVEPKPVVQPVEPPKAPEPPKVPEPQGVPLTALLEEREKRQANERELKELKARLASLEKPAPEIDPYQDLPGALSRQTQTLKQEMHARFVMMSEDMARAAHKDFDEVIGHFEKAVEANPALAAQMNASRNPAEFAYQQGLWQREIASAGDPTAYRSKLETELRKTIEAEFAAKYGKQPETPVPESLNSDGSPATKEPVYAGPPKLETLIGPKSRR